MCYCIYFWAVFWERICMSRQRCLCEMWPFQFLFIMSSQIHTVAAPCLSTLHLVKLVLWRVLFQSLNIPLPKLVLKRRKKKKKVKKILRWGRNTFKLSVHVSFLKLLSSLLVIYSLLLHCILMAFAINEVRDNELSQFQNNTVHSTNIVHFWEVTQHQHLVVAARADHGRRNQNTFSLFSAFSSSFCLGGF